MAILEVKNLSKSFDDLEVLKDISFNVEKGEVVAVMCGKRLKFWKTSPIFKRISRSSALEA